MALIYNNLLINKNSRKYKPFLINLLSGRRRLLYADELDNVISMLRKNDSSYYDEYEKKLFVKLVSEKQFITDDDRADIEKRLIETGEFDIRNVQSDHFNFSIELTSDCNMECDYCYRGSRTDHGQYRQLTKGHVDAIFRFFHKYADDKDKIANTPVIKITGGEPLVNKDAVDMINYIVLMWPNSKLDLFTNGINLIKYYDCLPLNSINEVHVSLDGTKEIHMQRRYSGLCADYGKYDGIIKGIKKLQEDGISVVVKTVLDKSNYINYLELHEFLQDEGIFDSPFYKHQIGVVYDFADPLDLDGRFNNKYNVLRIQEFIDDNLNVYHPLFFSLNGLYKMMSRPKNQRFALKHRRCASDFLANYFFSCNGNVYFCECMNEEKSIVGTYFPDITVDNETVGNLQNRSVMSDEKCKLCAYKFVCLGGCPKSAEGKDTKMSCGVFLDEEILDNLEFEYFR